MFFVYAIYNKSFNKVYIGQTSNIERRLREHNQKRGKHFTTNLDGEWVLIYKEETQTRNRALAREKQLKSYRGREFIKQYIPR